MNENERENCEIRKQNSRAIRLWQFVAQENFPPFIFTIISYDRIKAKGTKAKET